MNHKDVAEPDAVVSGMAGTGHNHGMETKIIEKSDGDTSKKPETHMRVVIGWDVLDDRNILPGAIREAVLRPRTFPDVAESTGDLAFSLSERDCRVHDRLQKKIDRLGHRIAKLKDQRRSP